MSSEKTAEKGESAFSSWKNRFREDFRFAPGRWAGSLAASFGAIFYKLIARLPMRLAWWARHFFVEGAALFRPEKPPAYSSRELKPDGFFKRVGIWLGVLALRTLDLVGAGEILNFATHVIKVNTRPLSALEVQEARRVFGDSLDYWRIRLDEWSLVAHYGASSYRKRFKRAAKHMAMTIYSTIQFSRRLETSPGSPDMAWLIHELVHTAQCEHTGGGFMLESLVAQGKAGYDYGGPAALAGRNLRDFNREQQGDIARDFYLAINGKKEVTDAERVEYERMIGQLRAGRL